MKRITKILIGFAGLLLVALGLLLPYMSGNSSGILEDARMGSLTAEERAFLNNLPPIRIGHIPDTPPIDFRNSVGQRKGLTWDYVALLEEKLGIEFERVECLDWEKALREGQIDLVGSIQKTPEREETFLFSKTYRKISMLILASKDGKEVISLDNMESGSRLCVVEDSAMHDTLEKWKAFRPAKYRYELIPVKNAQQGMALVAAGQVEAMVVDAAVSRYYMPRMGVDLRVAGDAHYDWNLSFASSTNSPLPTELLNKALGMITTQEKRTLEQQWPTLLSASELEKKLLIKVIGGSLAVTLLIIGASIFWNRTLRRQVARHLMELGRMQLSHAKTAMALDESEARFRNLVESSNDIIWEIDLYGSYAYVSPRVQDVLGYAPDELQGRSMLSLMITADSARMMETLRKRGSSGTIDCNISTCIHKDGGKVVLESSGKVFLNNDGEPAGFRGVSRDISERIAYEDALRNSEERFRNLVETTSDWIWEIDTTGRFTYSSPQSDGLLGYKPDELLKRRFTELMPKDESDRINRFLPDLINNGRPIDAQQDTYLHREKRPVILETSAIPFYNEEWEIKGYRGISRDITVRVAVEKQLAFERNLFHSFMEHAPDLIYFKDTEGRFIEINAAKARELRRPVEKILGKTDFDFLPIDQAQVRADDEAEVMKNRKAIQKEESAETPSGQRWYYTTKVPRFNEDGAVIGTFGTSWDITYRKQTEEQLRRLRTLLSNTIDSMPSVLVGVDAAGRVIQWNRQAEAETGRSAGSVLGLHLHNAYPEMEQEIPKVERAIRERIPQIEQRIQRDHDGHARYYDVTVFPLTGTTEGAVIRMDDVTERVLIEDSIRNIVEGVSAVGRRFFGSMVTQMGRTVDADYTYISEFTDEEHSRMQTIAVSDGGELAPNFSYDVAPTPCREVLGKAGFTFVEDVLTQYPDVPFLQQHKVQSYIGIPLVDSENREIGVMVALYKNRVEDVEFASSIMQVFAGRTAAELERLQATKELVGLRNLLENIINSMPSILIGVDAEGRVMQWNRGAEQASGIAAPDAHGKSLHQVFEKMDSELGSGLDALLHRGTQQHERIQTAINGEPRIVDVTVYPISADGMEGAVIRLDDVTDRVRIEEMMVQSEKMMSVGGLAAGMAHEINNPLAGIIQGLQVIRNRIMLDNPRNAKSAEESGITLESIRAYMDSRGLPAMIDSASEAAERAARIVDNMLSFSRKQGAQFEPHDLADIIDRSIELASNDYNLKKRFDFRHIEIVRNFDAVDPVSCESGQIQQVLLNLLSNSAQAMAEQPENSPTPRLDISLYREQDMAVIEVKDNGPGMDVDTRKRVFEPFFTTKEVGQGTGLGLSVSFFIITENHGGTLHLDSAPGRGACFKIRLPFEHRMERWGLLL